MSDNQKESTSKNNIDQYEDDNDPYYKADSNALESILFTENEDKIENISILTSEGNETLININDKKSSQINISYVLEPKKNLKKAENKKKEGDGPIINNTFQNIKVNKQILNNSKEYPIKKTYHTSKTTKKDDFSNNITIPIPKYLFDNSLEILFKKDIININKILLLYCLSNILFSIEYRAKMRYGLELKTISFINVKRINLDDYEKILNGTIEDLFIKFSNLNDEEKQSFKKEKEFLLNWEIENKFKFKLLNILFNKTIEEIFKMYLNDYKYIPIGKINLYFKKFKTFSDDFNEHSSKQKQNIKKCINLLFNKELANLEKKTIEEDNNEEQKYNFPKKSPVKNNNYNSRRKIIFTSLKSIFSNSIKEYVKFNFKIDLYQPTLKNKLCHNIGQYFKFLAECLIYIFTNLKPKRFNPKIDYSQQINDVLEKEEEIEENKILHKLLYSVPIFNIIKAFINDEKIVNIKEENGNEFEFYFINFKTYKDYFKYLSKETNDKYKKDFNNFLGNQIKSRKKSEKRNLILRNNNNLRKKRKRSN